MRLHLIFIFKQLSQDKKYVFTDFVRVLEKLAYNRDAIHWIVANLPKDSEQQQTFSKNLWEWIKNEPKLDLNRFTAVVWEKQTPSLSEVWLLLHFAVLPTKPIRPRCLLSLKSGSSGKGW